MEASIYGPSLFAGFAGTGGWCGRCRSIVPRGCGDLQGQRGQRSEVVAAVARDGKRGGPQGGRPAALCAGRRAGLAAGAALREARHYASGAGGGTGRARDQSELLRGLAFFRARRDQLQKKACTPASRIAPTSPGDERSGSPSVGESARSALETGRDEVDELTAKIGNEPSASKAASYVMARGLAV